MRRLVEILLPDKPGWPNIDHVGSVYVSLDAAHEQITHDAREQFGARALAYRFSGHDNWNDFR